MGDWLKPARRVTQLLCVFAQLHSLGTALGDPQSHDHPLKLFTFSVQRRLGHSKADISGQNARTPELLFDSAAAVYPDNVAAL